MLDELDMKIFDETVNLIDERTFGRILSKFMELEK